jgi:RimJ/RimL family protein N-acetyltransferase
VVWAAIEETRTMLEHWVPDIGRRRTTAEVRTGLETLVRLHKRGDSSILGIWSRRSGHFLGEVGVYHLDRGAALGEVGYWLRAGAQGHGYATEALGALLTYARTRLGLERFEAHIAADNNASRRVAERLGFQQAARRARGPRCAEDVGVPLIYVLQDRSLHPLRPRAG